MSDAKREAARRVVAREMAARLLDQAIGEVSLLKMFPELGEADFEAVGMLALEEATGAGADELAFALGYLQQMKLDEENTDEHED